MQRPIAIDLFSGCGGMSLGLEAAGFDVVASVEFDPVHMLVHHFNFPYGIGLCQDIRTLNTQSLLEHIRRKGFAGEIDLVAGGPPCQGFSSMGKRQLDDPRNSLIFEYLRVIEEIQPKYFIFENVPGLNSGEHQSFLEKLLREIERINYTIAKPIQVLDSSEFGAPQKRKRLILIGTRKSLKKAKYPTLKRKGIQPPTVGDAISDLAGINAFIKHDFGIPAGELDYSGFREKFALTPAGDYALCYPRQTDGQVWGHIGSKHTEKSQQRFLAADGGKLEKVSHLFKLCDRGLCNTLRAGTARDKGAYTAPRPIHYSQPRCITVREAARLHTFPDWFQFHRTIWHGFREIGNAVVPLLAKALGTEIIKCLKIDKNQLYPQHNIPLETRDRQYLKLNMHQACQYWQIPYTVIPKRQRPRKPMA
ncbi:DNA cytosine methyltransferase [Roseofilum sp. BLCC_M143]|uniref:Cytosine-specific methyltransferase n=1 Tax=Roseofilum casamattae BLCC-M143 TaxID=3022442 RepID=A0ABT7BS39_9CYAN|nr:DNA cytosine methyltransferase [Roseofilum casamattae]MDJ1182008.1 DNA cytosine methyltransferase [Roseofilum casamattae BLCC-M143]